MKSLGSVKDILTLTIAAALGTCGIHFFLVPSHIAIGGVSGLAIVLENFIPLKISMITLILNMALLVIGFFIIGSEFGAKTLYISLISPVFLAILEICFPSQQSIMGDAFLDLICYIVMGGIAMAMLFNVNASSGGLDIIAKILNKYFRMELGKASSMVGTFAALSAALVYDKKTVVLSVLGTYVLGMVIDYVIFGLDGKKRVCAVSKDAEAIQSIKAFIQENLKTTAAIYDSQDIYDDKQNKEILTLVNKNEYSRLMDYITKMDKEVFVTVYDVKEVVYHS